MAKKLLDPHMWDLETLFKCVYNVPVYQRPLQILILLKKKKVIIQEI